MRSKAEEILNKPGPLEGIRVVEYAVFHAGPGAGAILGDLGADVIKIEADGGDPIRNWDRIGDISFDTPGGSPMFDFSNRNKRGIYIDIQTVDGRKVFERLIQDADVFLTNLRKSTKPKLGLDYETIKGINSGIIYSSVTGYGKEGPVSDNGAFDPLGQARSGMMHLTAGEEPALIQLAVLDQATAITLSHAIMTALFTRERDGQGQEVHTSLFSSALWLTYANVMLSNLNIRMKDLVWERYRNTPMRNNFLCKDGKWIIGSHHPQDKYWSSFCEATDQNSLLDDPRFADSALRDKNCRELVLHFDIVFAEKTQQEWIEILTSKGLMFSPVQNVEDVCEDPQAIANNYIVDFEHPQFGNLKIPGYPIDFSRFSAGIRRPAPQIGEHTGEILREMGYSDKEIADLKEARAVK